MKQLFSAALLTCGLFVGAAAAQATDATPSISIKDAWIRATPNGAKVAGGYATITNTGGAGDRLVSASIPPAPNGEVHEMSMDGGIMRMRTLDKGLEIPPGGTITLQPSGYHIMFINPTAPLKEGETLAGTLTFEKAGTIPVTFAVAGMGAKAAPSAMSMDHGSMDHMNMDMK